MSPNAPPQARLENPRASRAESPPAWARVWHARLFLALLMGFGVGVVLPRFGLDGLSGRAWPISLFLVLGMATTLAWCCLQLPAQNVLGAAVVIAALAGALTVVGARTGLPLGPDLSLRHPLGGRLLWPFPLLWVLALLNSRGVASLILRPWRRSRDYGFRLLALACLLAAVLELGWERLVAPTHAAALVPAAATPPAGLGAVAEDVAGRTITALVALVGATPWLIKKRPSASWPHASPLFLWGLFAVWGVVECAARRHWPAAAAGLAAWLLVVGLAVRGGRSGPV